MIHTSPVQPIMDPDLETDLNALIDEVVPDAATWKETPNAALGGERPAAFINTPREHILRDLVRAAKHGMAS